MNTTYTAEQIRQAGKDGEINSIDVEHLISLLPSLNSEGEDKEASVPSNDEAPVVSLTASSGNSIGYLTPDNLEAMGFKKDTIDNPFFSGYSIQIGRGREISVANPNTPNEMIFINDFDGEKRTCVVVRNFDYDGKTSLSFIKQLYQLLNPQPEVQVSDTTKVQ